MILKLLLALSLNPAFAKSAECGPMLAGQDLYAAGFEHAVQDLDRRGLTVLTEAFHNGDFKVRHASFGLPIDIRDDEVLVRVLPEGQLGTWQVANALFEYETRKDFKKTKWFWPKDGGIFAMLKSDKSILSYIGDAPAAWRQEVLERVGQRETALQKLYSQLDQVQSDPRVPLSDGKLKFKYWMGNLLRAVMVGTTLFTIADIPHQYAASEVAVQQTMQAQEHHLSSAQVHFILQERDQLMNGIHYQLGLPVPNQQLLTQMKDDLAHLHKMHPELVESPQP